MKAYKQLMAAQLLATFQMTSVTSPFGLPRTKKRKVYQVYNTNQEQARRLKQRNK